MGEIVLGVGVGEIMGEIVAQTRATRFKSRVV
jgi:hypothetical protein